MTIWGALHMHARIDLEDELRKLVPRKFEGMPFASNGNGMKVPDYLREFDQDI